jgi:CspA family cold shock protein
MATGRVKWFDADKGFGFIVNENGQDVFVHYSNIRCEGFRALREGQIVEYDEDVTPKGLSGRNVRISEPSPNQ